MTRVRFLAGLFLALCTAVQAFSQAPPGGPTFTVSDLPQDRPLRVVVYGDMRFTNPSNTSDTQPGVRRWLAQKVGEEKPDVLLITGDMPLHGSDPADWAVYRQETALWTQEKLRVFPTIGNHEGLTDPIKGIANYMAAYPQVANHRWYSVRMGNIYLITLDSSTFMDAGTEQQDWLRDQLAHLPEDVDFVFFLFHLPLVADLQTSFMLGIPNAPTLALRRELEAKASVSHAKFVVFNGHIHNYERFELNGITHVITGGGGARPYPILVRGDQDLFQGHSYPNFNYVLITLAGKHAEAKMYRVVDPDAAQRSVELKDHFNLDAR